MKIASALLLRTSGRFFGLVLYFLCLAGVWSTAAQDHSALSTSPTFDQSPIQSRFPPVRFALLVETWQDEDVILVPDASGLYEVSLAPTGLANLNVYRETLYTFTPLAWINYRYSNALQFHLSQFVMPLHLSAIEDVPTLLFAHKAENLPPRWLTVLQVHGRFSLGAQDYDTLHYTLYAGMLSAENPHDLVAGVRLGYMAGTSGFTIGIDYLYGHYAISSDIFRSFYAVGSTQLPGSNVGVFGRPLLYEKDELFLVYQTFLHSAVEGGPPPLAIHAKPALHINQQWTVFYRFNRLHSRSGIAKMPGRAIGLKFQPIPSITLHAEFIMKHVAAPGGFWVAGTVHF
jgi:hypothetical protein